MCGQRHSPAVLSPPGFDPDRPVRSESLYQLRYPGPSKTRTHAHTHTYIYTGLFISLSGTSELDCATTKTDTAERSISIGRESLKVFFVLGALAYLKVIPLGGSRDEKWRARGIRKRSVSWNLPKLSQL